MESSVKGVLQAAHRGDRKAVDVIIAEGRVGVADEDGNTPLMYAAASGREDVIRLLLEKVVRGGGMDKRWDKVVWL